MARCRSPYLLTCIVRRESGDDDKTKDSSAELSFFIEINIQKISLYICVQSKLVQCLENGPTDDKRLERTRLSGVLKGSCGKFSIHLNGRRFLPIVINSLRTT
jgi:hypothetical protein